MKLVSWNVNSLSKRIENGFKQVLADLDADIVCLQETKLQKDAFKQDFPGYEAYWNCAEEKGTSGTAVLTKVHPCCVTCGIGEYDGDGRVITAEFSDFYLVCYYSPLRPDGNKLKKNEERNIQQDAWSVYQDNFRKYIGGLMNKKNVIICGDFNITRQSIDSYSDNGKQGCTEEEREAFAKLIVAGFVDTYRYLFPDKVAYSWWRHETEYNLNHGNRLDYFLVSEGFKDRIQAAEIYDEKVKGDHCPIGLVINIPQK